MNDLRATIQPPVSQQMEPLDLQSLNLASDQSESGTRKRIQQLVRTRTKVLRVLAPVDDGFRPFRVF